jgi:hypothetical protein
MDSSPEPGRGSGDPFVGIDADLDSLATLPASEQVPVFSRIHTALTAALDATAVSNDRPPGGGR